MSLVTTTPTTRGTGGTDHLPVHARIVRERCVWGLRPASGGASPKKREHAESDAAGICQGVVLWTAAETRVGVGLDMRVGGRSESASQLFQHLRNSEGLQRDDMFSVPWSVA
jgi:hypothetical protein